MKGKTACPAKAVPEETLLSVFDGVSFERVLLHPENRVEVEDQNGRMASFTWQDPSRKDSWSEEMKTKAREKYYGGRNANTGDKKSVHDTANGG